MKNKTLKKLGTLMLAFTLTFSTVPAQLVTAETTTIEAQAETTTTATIKSKWVKTSAGYCYYNKDGRMLKNEWATIGGKKYYFGSNGARKTGWYTIKDSKGYKSYYFDSKGVLNSKKTKSIDKTLVTLMDKFIKGQKITDATSKSTALKKLFTKLTSKDYNYARAPLGFKAPKGWEYTFAKEMLGNKKGSCYHYAAAYAFLAKRATGYPVRVCWGTSNAFNTKRWQPHAWVEIKIGSTWYTYDANAARYSTLKGKNWYQQKRTAMEGKVYKTQKYVNVEI